MHEIAIAEPVVSGQEAIFAWSVTPASPLYERTSFRLRFPASVDLTRVPESLWWRVAIMCLHAHWPLLGECRVTLPVRLPPGEAETWLRLTDAAVATLEAHVGGERTDRSIEIAEFGPMLPLAPSPGAGDGGVISCFSGGRDSTVQAAMLDELGAAPTLVTVTSPVHWSNEHSASRRREVLDEITRRRSFELIEVDSDLRSSWDNGFPMHRYGVTVNELADTFLYLAAAVVVATARGAPLVLMASEADVQENAKRDGMVVQARHFMYSAATHRVLTALLSPAGVRIGSLTYPLRQFQVQRLLAERYMDVRDLQFSCWELERDEVACSRCPECRGIALNLVARGVPPAVAGIDLTTLLIAQAGWQPGRGAGAGPLDRSLPRASAGRAHEQQELRCLAGTPAERVADLIDGDHPEPERRRALEVYERLRQSALGLEIEPEPGFRSGYLKLVDEALRDGVRAILEEHFDPAPPDSYERMLRNARTLSEWVAAPLRRVPAPELREPDPSLVPDPEPPLERAHGGRVLRVMEPLLDGNELRYVSECVNENWISSAGGFVRRFEEEFAAAVGCRYAIACSSGTAALHLALAGAGVSAGDEVIVPAFTMIATANAPRYVGADPVLVDAEPVSWNLDPERLGDKLSRRTRAVIVVHTYGQPAAMDPVREFADRNGLLLVEDAAEAHGASYGGRPVGSLGDVAAFSLYGNKILTTGEGGVVTTNDERIAALARELRDHAFSKERHFWHRRVGFNYRMTNLQAAVGVAQTERLPDLLAVRETMAARYRHALGDVEGIELLPDVEGGVTWMFGIRVTDRFRISRDELRKRLAARGVETRTFFVPLHIQPVYAERFRGQSYPVAEELGRSGLYLPSGPQLTAEDIAYVADAVSSA